MIAMGVAFLSNSIHDPDGNMMNRENHHHLVMAVMVVKKTTKER